MNGGFPRLVAELMRSGAVQEIRSDREAIERIERAAAKACVYLRDPCTARDREKALKALVALAAETWRAAEDTTFQWLIKQGATR